MNLFRPNIGNSGDITPVLTVTRAENQYPLPGNPGEARFRPATEFLKQAKCGIARPDTIFRGYAFSGDSVADTRNLDRKALQSSSGVLVPY